MKKMYIDPKTDILAIEGEAAVLAVSNGLGLESGGNVDGNQTEIEPQ